ncbi:run domain Beclin-1-interacting and cysteine-rich domain-containing protein isoform X2 [Daktulosphaira vitifoliae]|uniref:run domain Beclin-1-interacting and cysteine-rich domain-containing protein isoform X2 n=1 Tax=Daktulosphaira vitifoliae TaxID=58002 RepID=UPI0021AAC7BA|nr:run domain Beclin-1-interacting and cysteine-rich domain-containing protein isoform X2 [Daktulosphaira vitifoliae]
MENDCIWQFIQGLDWLYPMIETTNLFFKNSVKIDDCTNKSSVWIYKSLENHTLSEKLGWLLSDKSHISKFYKPEAFLCQKKYSDAALLCLKAVELNQPSLLLEIDPKLYLNPSLLTGHCTTLPKSNKNKYIGHLEPTNDLKMEKSLSILHDISDLKEIKPLIKDSYTSKIKYKSCPNINSNFDKSCNVRRSYSHGAVSELISDISNSNSSINTENVQSELLIVNYEQLVKENSELNKYQLSNDGKMYNYSTLRKRKKRRAKFSLPLRTLDESDDDDNWSKNSDGSRTLVLHDEAQSSKFIESPKLVSQYFPGHDLFKFLSSGKFAQANAELSRENAHFTISEVIIATIEQIKCNQKLNFVSETLDESDEEINNLKQRIQSRRRQKQFEMVKLPLPSTFDCISESTKTDYTMSSLTSSYCSTTSSLSTTDTDELENENEIIDYSSKISVCNSPVSSLYSNIDLRTPSSCSMITAESVARSLIRQFNHENSPSDCNIQWLISENEVAQKTLPLPSSYPVNPYEPEDLKTTSLRGTSFWAPPRPQIIFTTHPPPIRKKVMEQQGYRCAGCSMKVDIKYASKFRYCFYLGRYFCTGCHIDKTAIIPGRIISKWDFSKYPVSCFSFTLLEQLLGDPLFNIADLNNELYKRARGLDRVRLYRQQLSYIRDFIFLCRYANKLQELLDELEPHLIPEPDLYSIQNMIDVKNGDLGKKLQSIIISCNKHVTNCQLCQARGFSCEICKNNDVLFPWDFRKVTKCNECGSCYHAKCFVSRKFPICPRCPRLLAMFKRKDCKSICEPI